MNKEQIKKLNILNDKKEKHCHATKKGRMGYWKHNEAHGCRMCYLNRKLTEAMSEIKKDAVEKEGEQHE